MSLSLFTTWAEQLCSDLHFCLTSSFLDNRLHGTISESIRMNKTHRNTSALVCTLLQWSYTLWSTPKDAITTCMFSRVSGISSPAPPITLTVWQVDLTFVLSGSTKASRHWVSLRGSWSSSWVWTVSSEYLRTFGAAFVLRNRNSTIFGHQLWKLAISSVFTTLIPFFTVSEEQESDPFKDESTNTHMTSFGLRRRKCSVHWFIISVSNVRCFVSSKNNNFFVALKRFLLRSKWLIPDRTMWYFGFSPVNAHSICSDHTFIASILSTTMTKSKVFLFGLCTVSIILFVRRVFSLFNQSTCVCFKPYLILGVRQLNIKFSSDRFV